MTQDLSKQICEKCGIEPKYICSYTGDGCPVESISEFNSRCPLTKVVKECETRSKKLKYPDFGQPENFVKLFNLKAYLIGSITDTITTNYNVTDVNSYLKGLLNELDFGIHSIDIENCIREAEWRYE